MTGCMTRGDVFWRCKTCLPRMIALLGKDRTTHELNLENVLKSTVHQSIKSVIPEVLDDCMNGLNNVVSQKLTANMSKLWSDTLYGDDFPALDTSIITQKAADREVRAQASKSADEKPRSLFGALKNVVKQQQNEDRHEELRRKTVVIFKAPEETETDPAKCKKLVEDKVDEVVEAIGVDVRPKNIYRVGKKKMTNADQSRLLWKLQRKLKNWLTAVAN